MSNLLKYLIAILVVSCVYLYTSKSALKDKYEEQTVQLNTANATIKYITDENHRINLINSQNGQEIRRLELQSSQDRERLKDAMQNSDCASVPLPDDVINILRKRADNANNPNDTRESH